MLENDEFLQNPRIQQLKQQIAETDSENDKRKFLALLAKEIVRAINSIALQKFDNEVNVSNFDEVTAALRNELSRANKPLLSLLSQLNLTTQQQSQLISDIEAKGEKEFKSQFQPVLIKRPKDLIEITNFEDMPIADNVTVSNLSELEAYFKSLEDCMKMGMQITLPAPQVTVQPTPINIPELKIPELDLSPIVEELQNQLKKLSTNNKSNPLAVRLTDGANWIKEFKAIADRHEKAITQYMSDVAYIKNAAGQTVNPATAEGQSAPTTIGDGTKVVTTAGTRVALGGSVACKKVTITALDTNTGKIYWGGATVAATSGAYIYAGQTQIIDIDNLSKVYIDSGVNGEGVNYSYVA